MPTINPPVTNPTQVTPSPVRKSARVRKIAEPFDPSEANEKPPEEVAPPTHNLQENPSANDSSEGSSDSDSSNESSKPPSDDAADSFSKRQLWQRWTGANMRADTLKSTLADVRKQLRDVSKEKKTLEQIWLCTSQGKQK